MSDTPNKLKTITPANRAKRLLNRSSNAARYYFLPRRAQRPLFVLAEPRTGSTLIGDYLNSVPGVSVASEILSPTLPCGLPADGISKAAVRRHIIQSLNAQPGSISGAKYLLAHLTMHDVTLDDLRQWFPTAVYLIVYRGSLLEQYVSFQVAKATHKWVGLDKRDQFQDRIHVDADDFMRFCSAERDKYSKILSYKWIHSCSRIVRYEDLASRPQAVFDADVFSLLGLPSTPIVTNMVKQIDRKMPDVIENYDELQKIISNETTHAYQLNVPHAGLGLAECQSKSPETCSL